MKTFSTHFIRENNSSIVSLSFLTSLHKSVTILSTVLILVSSALTLLDKSVTLSSTIIILDLFSSTLLDTSDNCFLVTVEVETTRWLLFQSNIFIYRSLFHFSSPLFRHVFFIIVNNVSI